MNTAIIIVTMGEWDKYVIPYVRSIRDFEDCHIMIVNNSNINVPKEILDVKDCMTFQTRIGQVSGQETLSYAHAINKGLFGISWWEDRGVKFDWVIISNDDVLLQDEFTPYLREMNPNYIYGERVHYKSKYFKPPCSWIDGWIYIAPRQLLEVVGGFDSKFQVAGFEDADYCFRAYKLGFAIGKSYLPFIHLKKHTRKQIKDFKKKRLENMEYLIDKHELTRKF